MVLFKEEFNYKSAERGGFAAHIDLAGLLAILRESGLTMMSDRPTRML